MEPTDIPKPEREEKRAGAASKLFVGLLLAGPLLALAGYLAWQRQLRGTEFPVISEVHDFSLTNQAGQHVALGDLRGKTWVADVIFTRCPGPCAMMTRTMADLQKRLPRGANVALVSLTADPEFDTPAVLSRYAARFGADLNSWQFLTGDKQQIYRLALDDLKLAVAPDDSPEARAQGNLFVHSTKFMVVDREGKVRAYFDGAEPGAAGLAAKAIRQLAKQNR